MQIILPVGPLNVPGAWVPCDGLGAFPEGQLDPAAIPADAVELQSAGVSTATVGKKILTFNGGVPSTNVSQQSGGVIKQYTSIPLAFCRAIRRAGSTPGINLNLTSTNVGAVGPAGPSGIPVQGSCILAPGAAPWVFLQPGSRGVTSVSVVALGLTNQIHVLFSYGGLATANYSLNAAWWSSAGAPFVLQPVGWDPVDGRTTTGVTFELQPLAGGAPIDAKTVTGGLMFSCG